MEDLYYFLYKMDEITNEMDRMETDYHAKSRIRSREARERRRRNQKKRMMRTLLTLGSMLTLPVCLLFALRLRIHWFSVPQVFSIDEGVLPSTSYLSPGREKLSLPFGGGERTEDNLEEPDSPADTDSVEPTGEAPSEPVPVSGSGDGQDDAFLSAVPMSMVVSGEPVSSPENAASGAVSDTTSGAANPTSGAASGEAALGAAGSNGTASGSAAGGQSAPLFSPYNTRNTVQLNEDADLDSAFAVVVDAQTGAVLAERNSEERISPASMTKVLTLLVAVEHIRDWSVTGSVTPEISSYCYRHGLSIAGFAAGEELPVRDLLYGCILPSGADACLALANLLAGSEEAFVEWMNEKATDLGIAKTAHFTNTIGLYDENHLCTVRDLTVIIRAAMANPTCRTVLGARTHRTAQTEAHPEGILLSNWFLRRIEDRFTGTNLAINGGKTGYISQAGSCAVSLATRDDGTEYLCATGKAPGSWQLAGHP